MSQNVVHFAVQADDVGRARAFYESVFGWRFEAWGPPDFYLIHTGDASDEGIHGALQQRQQPLEGTGTRGFECTISVTDLAHTQSLISEHGGQVLFGPETIPTVGSLIQFSDTEGNIACAMCYEAASS